MTEFEGEDDSPILENEFFSRAQPGDLVEVKGTFNGTLIQAREVSLEGDSSDDDSSGGDAPTQNATGPQ